MGEEGRKRPTLNAQRSTSNLEKERKALGHLRIGRSTLGVFFNIPHDQGVGLGAGVSSSVVLAFALLAVLLDL
jgi:hypothetical protein